MGEREGVTVGSWMDVYEELGQGWVDDEYVRG